MEAHRERTAAASDEDADEQEASHPAEVMAAEDREEQ